MPDFRLSDEISIYASLDGDSQASPVLLLHGLGANADSWLLQVPALVQAGYRTISPDFRGFGRSSSFQKPEIHDLSGDILGLLDLLSIKSCFVVGISMGGTVALQLGMDHPEMVTKIVLVNTFARLWPVPPRTLVKFFLRFLVLKTRGLSAQARSVTNDMFPEPSQVHLRDALYQQILQSDPQTYRHLMRSLIRFDVRARLSEIKQPTLILTGTDDQTVSPRLQQLMAEQIPNATQILIPGAGHALTGQQPDVVNQAIIDFFGQTFTKATNH
jgi:3-oxoadipate enol-lactonase